MTPTNGTYKTSTAPNGKEVVKWTKGDVKAYLDYCIQYWRHVKMIQQGYKKDKPLAYHAAICNIDTYQAVRDSLFGETLP